MRASVPVIAIAAAVLATGASRPDLDVAVPPGSPLVWSRSFPAATPMPGPLFPERSTEAKTVAHRSEARERPGSDAATRVATAMGLLRITTWDLASEVAWVPRAARAYGEGQFLYAPEAGYGMYWTSITPLLRLMLHPSQVTRAETIVHLLELGDPVRRVLDAALTEGSLRRPVQTLRDLLGPEFKTDPDALLGDIGLPSSSRAELLARFVREELLRFHPYDPEGSFGQRLFLFGDDLEPFVRRFTRADEALLRRNAVAALGRYETATAREALLALAAETKDAVVLARALAALAGVRGLSFGPLLARLDKAKDDWEIAALVGALSRSGVEDITPYLVQLGQRGLDHDSDLAVIALSALARIHHRKYRNEVLAFAERCEKRARSNPRAFRPERPDPSAAADVPDPPDARGRLLVHLSLIVRAHLDSLDEELAKKLVELQHSGGSDANAWRRTFSRSAADGLLPPARFAYLETLARVGDPGLDVVRSVANDAGSDPMLRATAIALLPYDERVAIALTAIDDAGELPSLRAFGLELLVLDRHRGAAAAARALLREMQDLEPGSLDASLIALRSLYQRAVRTLVSEGWARTEDFLPLLPHVATSRSAGGVEAVLVERVAALVELVASGKKEKHVDSALDALVELAVIHQLGPRIVADPDGTRAYIAGQLAGIDDRRRDEAYEALVARAVTEFLIGRPLEPSGAVASALASPVALEEEILLALGGVGGAEISEALLPMLASGTDSPHRAAVILALGRLGAKASLPQLARELIGKRPLDRLCAYEALRHVSGQDFFADWLTSDGAKHTTAAEGYWAWAVANR